MSLLVQAILTIVFIVVGFVVLYILHNKEIL